MSDDIPLRRCTKCGEEFPATLEYFNSQPGGKYGLKAECKACRSKWNRLYWNRPEMQDYRKDYYSQPEARERQKKLIETYRSKPEAHERLKTYYKTYSKAYYVKHKEEPKFKEKQRVKSQRYHVRHKEQPKYKERHLIKENRRRARKLAVAGTYTAAQIQEQLKHQKYRCYYAACGHAKFEKRNGKYIYQIDHTYPLSRVAGTDIPANDMGYLVLACPTCNDSKGSKFPWEWPEGGRLL